MHQSYWELWECDEWGRRSRLVIDPSLVEVHQVEDDIGRFRVALPIGRYRYLLNRTNRLWEVWRSVARGGMMQNLGVYFARGFEQDGAHMEISGPDINALIGQYIVAYNAETLYSDKTGFAGNLVLQYGRENFLTLATDAERDLTRANVSIQADAAIGDSLSKSASRRQLLSLYNSLRESSALAGKPFFVRMVPTQFNPLKMELRIYPYRLGRDFTSNGKRRIVLSEDAGTLKNVSWSIDYQKQVNAMYAGGSGQGKSRLTVLVIDDTRVTGPLGRMEGWSEDTQIGDQDALLDFAEEKLEQARPQLRMNATLAETGELRYGYWGLGDVFDAVNALQLYQVRVRAVSARIDKRGGEKIDARLDGYQPEVFVGTSMAEVP